MADNPDLFVRVSTPRGHFNMPRAMAERGGATALKSDARDASGHLTPPKPREAIDAPRRKRKKPRGDTAAATPTTDPGTVPGEN